LDDHAVELEAAGAALLLERAEDADQVAAHRAADAAVVHLHDLLVGLLDDLDLLAVILLQDAVEERGLAAAEKPGQDGDRYHLLLLHRGILRHDFEKALPHGRRGRSPAAARRGAGARHGAGPVRNGDAQRLPAYAVERAASRPDDSNGRRRARLVHPGLRRLLPAAGQLPAPADRLDRAAARAGDRLPAPRHRRAR